MRRPTRSCSSARSPTRRRDSFLLRKRSTAFRFEAARLARRCRRDRWLGRTTRPGNVGALGAGDEIGQEQVAIGGEEVGGPRCHLRRVKGAQRRAAARSAQVRRITSSQDTFRCAAGTRIDPARSRKSGVRVRMARSPSTRKRLLLVRAPHATAIPPLQRPGAPRGRGRALPQRPPRASASAPDHSDHPAPTDRGSPDSMRSSATTAGTATPDARRHVHVVVHDVQHHVGRTQPVHQRMRLDQPRQVPDPHVALRDTGASCAHAVYRRVPGRGPHAGACGAATGGRATAPPGHPTQREIGRSVPCQRRGCGDRGSGREISLPCSAASAGPATAPLRKRGKVTYCGILPELRRHPPAI